MSDQGNQNKLQFIRTKTRRRLLFTLVTLLLYFAFALNWTDAGGFLSQPLGDTAINGSLLMFIALIVIFIALEFAFLAINKSRDKK